jgi:hypothetical protein
VPLRTLLMAALIVAPAAALADQQAADACAAALPTEARAIYDATLPQALAGADLRDAVTTQTRALVGAGQVKRMSARGSAEAAGKCLKLAQG